MPECPHCFKEIEADSAYCQHCGQKIADTASSDEKAAAAAPLRSELKLGEYLKTGWQIFRQFPLGFVFFTLIYFIVLAIISYPRGIGWLAAAAVHEPLVAGFVIVSAKILQEKTPTFGDFFGGFQFKYFLPLVLLGVVSRVLITIGLILLIIPGLYLAVSYIFATLLVVDQHLDFWPAMEQSRKFVTPRWFSFFVFLLLLVLVNLAGILALGVGLLVSLPVSWCALMAAYADQFGLKSTYDQVP